MANCVSSDGGECVGAVTLDDGGDCVVGAVTLDDGGDCVVGAVTLVETLVVARVDEV